MTELRRILAAVGEFPQDNDVLARAAELASAHRASLAVVHVIEFPDLFELAPSDVARLQQDAERAAHVKIKDAFARAAPAFSNADIHIEIGAVASGLIKVCNILAPDLIVMRGHQCKSILTKLVGSTTDRVVRAASAPVLVVKRPAEAPYHNALFASDGLDDGAGALTYLAGLLPSAALHLIQVVHILPQLKQSLISTGLGQSAIDAHHAMLIRNAKDNLRTLSAGLNGRPTKTTTRVATGDPASALVNASRSPKVDLIVVGPARAGMLRRALIGSVTQRVLRDAACDVLIWRPSENGE